MRKTIEINHEGINYQFEAEFFYKDHGNNPDPREDSGKEYESWHLVGEISAYDESNHRSYTVTNHEHILEILQLVDFEDEFNKLF